MGGKAPSGVIGHVIGEPRQKYVDIGIYIGLYISHTLTKEISDA